MSTELVRVDDINIDSMKQIGALLAESGYFTSENVRASAAQLVVKVMAGRELGYGPWASAAGIHIIKGKMSISANMMADAVKRSGRYDYRIREMSDKKVCIEFFAVEGGKRESLGVSEFTIEDGKKAGTQNLDKYPRNMMFARAMSNGVKWFAPDCFNGNAVYVPEEMGASVDGDGNVIDVTPSGSGNGNQSTDAPAMADERTLKHLHACGSSLYGDDWDTKRHELVSKVTKKRSQSSKDLTQADADKLIAGIEAKLQAELEKVAAEMKAEPEAELDIPG